MALQQVAIPVPSHESDEPIGKLDSYEGALGGVTRREF